MINRSAPIAAIDAIGLIDIKISSRDLYCPITQDIFFDPAMANCGHPMEKSALRNISNCPLCRAEISSIHPVSPLFQTVLSSALANDHKLYEEVYFNLDDFANDLNECGLNTVIGQKYIHLLQQAPSLLERKASSGAQKNKTALELLVNSEAGCDLLRKDPILKNSLLPAAKQFVDSHLSRQGLFATTSSQQTADPVIQQIIYANANATELLVRAKPQCLRQKAHATDYSGILVEKVTPLQAALRTHDIEMCRLLIKHLNRLENGEAEVIMQFRRVFPCGTQAYFAAQKPFDFNSIVQQIANSKIADIRSAINKEQNETPICVAFHEFRNDFKTSVQSENVFNPKHLLQALRIYRDALAHWQKIYRRSELNSRLELLWRQVIGYVQRFLPACYAQIFAQGIAEMLKYDEALARDFKFRDKDSAFYPLARASDQVGLGFNFAIGPNGGKRQLAPSKATIELLLEAFETVIANKTNKFADLIPPELQHFCRLK